MTDAIIMKSKIQAYSFIDITKAMMILVNIGRKTICVIVK